MKKLRPAIALSVILLLILIVSCKNEGHQKDKIFSNSIINGRNADPSEIPWQVSLQNSDGHFCGGSIISKKFILTAAHCVSKKSAKNIYVMSGGELQDELIKLPSVKKIITSNYKTWFQNKGIKRHDIALLELSNNIELSSKIAIIDLPEVSTNADIENLLLNAENNIIITGWGITENTTRPDHLQVVENVKLYPLPDSDFWDEENKKIITEGYYSLIDYWGTYSSGDYIVSKVENGKSLCRGDSGGPIAIKNKNILLGVASHLSHHSCYETDVLYYTSVISHRKWIDSHIKRK